MFLKLLWTINKYSFLLICASHINTQFCCCNEYWMRFKIEIVKLNTIITNIRNEFELYQSESGLEVENKINGPKVKSHVSNRISTQTKGKTRKHILCISIHNYYLHFWYNCTEMLQRVTALLYKQILNETMRGKMLAWMLKKDINKKERKKKLVVNFRISFLSSKARKNDEYHFVMNPSF